MLQNTARNGGGDRGNLTLVRSPGNMTLSGSSLGMNQSFSEMRCDL